MDKKDLVIHIRIDEHLKNLLEKHAAAEYRPLTNYIYKLLRESMQRIGEPIKPILDLSDDELDQLAKGGK